MTITFDLPDLDPATKARWETQLPLFAAKWPVGRIGGVMLGDRTYYLQRTGVDTLRLAVDKDSFTTALPLKVDALAALYHALWLELHSGALVLETPEQRQDLVQSVTQRVPSTCGCMGHWRNWINAHPFDYGSQEAFFAGTVEAHNGVSERLKKPVLTVAEALALYES